MKVCQAGNRNESSIKQPPFFYASGLKPNFNSRSVKQECSSNHTHNPSGMLNKIWFKYNSGQEPQSYLLNYSSIAKATSDDMFQQAFFKINRIKGKKKKSNSCGVHGGGKYWMSQQQKIIRIIITLLSRLMENHLWFTKSQINNK